MTGGASINARVAGQRNKARSTSQRNALTLCPAERVALVSNQARQGEMLSRFRSLPSSFLHFDRYFKLARCPILPITSSRFTHVSPQDASCLRNFTIELK